MYDTTYLHLQDIYSYIERSFFIMLVNIDSATYQALEKYVK